MTLSDLSIKMVLLVFAGVFAGSFMDSIAGGGGLITLPCYLLAGLPAHYALGTNKFSSCLGTSISTIRYAVKGYINFKLAIPAAVIAIIGAHLGTKLQLIVDERYLQAMLIVLLPVVAVIVLRQRKFPETTEEMKFSKRAAIVWASALVIGVYDGFYGPGTGTFLLLIFCKLAKLDVRQANGMVKAINVSSNFGALATSLINGKVFIALGLIAMVASMSGNYLGSGVAIKNGSKIVKPMVITVLVLLTIKVVSGFLGV